jgi:hypothetical protein
MYFHTDDPETIAFIAAVAQTAVETGTRLRLDVDGNGHLRVKRGEGAWTAPFYGTPDPYRDSQTTQSCRACDYAAAGKWDGAASVAHTCGQ